MKNKSNKTRVNLYIDEELLEFGKKFAYVMGTSISKILEGKLHRELERIKALSPEDYLQKVHDEAIEEMQSSIEYLEKIQEWQEEILNDEAEAEYCRKNPDSPRAKMRLELLRKREEKEDKKAREFAKYEKESEKRKADIIRRWNETF